VTCWVVRIIPSFVGEGEKLPANLTLVIGSLGVPFAIGTSGDELSAGPTAFITARWRLWRWSEVYPSKCRYIERHMVLEIG
jgi:hypothetical protein